MIALFIHQNFPAQYLHVVSRLAANKKNKIYFITQTNYSDIPGVAKILYKPDLPAFSNCHPYCVSLDAAVRTGTAVAEVCKFLRSKKIHPDVIVGHCGWGETFFVKTIFPAAPLLSYFEFFYHFQGADVGFDAEFGPAKADDEARLLVRNATNRISFDGCDWGHTATNWQRSLFPSEMQSRISALHEGVDTECVRPDPKAWLSLAREKMVLTANDEIITYVSRNLEPYRGFHIFMRALPELLRLRPKAHVLIVGGDGLSYGDPPPGGATFRQLLLDEVASSLDLRRVHFLGQLPYNIYLNVLQVSSVHIHLTYPFVLSWSLLEAMSAGCLVVGSATGPVLEIIRDRENGLLVDFFDTEQICNRVVEVLEHPDQMKEMREAARATVVFEFDTRSVTLPMWDALLRDLIAGKYPASQAPLAGPVVPKSRRKIATA